MGKRKKKKELERPPSVRSEHPRRERNLQNQISRRETEWNRDHRCQTELEQVLKRESHQRNDNEYDDRGLDDIDGVRVSLQESGEAARPVEPDHGKRDAGNAPATNQVASWDDRDAGDQVLTELETTTKRAKAELFTGSFRE